LDSSTPANGGEGGTHRVCFMNRFARGNQTFTPCQRSLVISCARSCDAAIKTAKPRFAALEGIPDWHLRASFIDPDCSKTMPPPAAKRRSSVSGLRLIVSQSHLPSSERKIHDEPDPVATDGSEGAEREVEAAADLAGKLDSRLVVALPLLAPCPALLGAANPKS
jgi:hypothetical protein